MRVHILGSAAGGGFPQWNCGCDQCRGVRDGTLGARPRTQSSVCVSADGRRWLLVNTSPDVRAQVTSFPPLAPPPGALRGSGIAAILLTNADIDHAAGLLVLREGGVPPVYTTDAVQRSLTEGLSILTALEAYGPVDRRRIELDRPFEVTGRDGAPIGLTVTAFAVASKPPPYMTARGAPRDDLGGDTIGLIVESRGGAPSGVLAYVPAVREPDAALRRRLERADAVLIDGTFYTDDELVAMGASRKTAREMGHAPLAGDGGLLAFLRELPRPRKVLVHINNSNPVLVEGSEARLAVEAEGVQVAYDGMELAL